MTNDEYYMVLLRGVFIGAIAYALLRQVILMIVSEEIWNHRRSIMPIVTTPKEAPKD